MNDIFTLFAHSFWGAMIVGAVCPLIGVFFVVRRVVFLGIAVPQFAAAGVAFGFMALPWWCEWFGNPGDDPFEAGGNFSFYLCCAVLSTLVALLILALLARKDGAASEGRIAAGYAFAAAVTLLLLSGSARGSSHLQALFRGEILALSRGDLWIIVILFGMVLVLFLLFNKHFLLVGYDREAAISLGYNPLLWDILLYTLVGTSISVGVLTVGPLVIFGLMVIPPLAARLLAFNMMSFYLLSSAIGLITAVLGFVLSYRLDWPLGPTDVVLSFAIMTWVWMIRGLGMMIFRSGQAG
ncbi:MAG: metal ABC transporter permease [Planctomycetota bacterium]